MTTSLASSFQSLSAVKEADKVAEEFDFAFAPLSLFIVARRNDEIDVAACVSLVAYECYLMSLVAAAPRLDFSLSIFIGVRLFVVHGEERIVGK